MTKADLVEQVTASIARTAGPMISKKDCARVVDAFLDAVKAALKEQHNIEVRGFGTFKIRRRKTRMAVTRAPASRWKWRPAGTVFKPSKELRSWQKI
jgi:integration host factor subunit beta